MGKRIKKECFFVVMQKGRNQNGFVLSPYTTRPINSNGDLVTAVVAVPSLFAVIAIQQLEALHTDVAEGAAGLGREGCDSVMAGSAVFALVHGLHREIRLFLDLALFHFEGGLMTTAARQAELIDMLAVIKDNRLDRRLKDKSCWQLEVAAVAFGATTRISDGKGGLAVMTDSAVFPLLECSHVEIARSFGCASCLLENAVMAVYAAEACFFNMKLMLKQNHLSGWHGRGLGHYRLLLGRWSCLRLRLGLVHSGLLFRSFWRQGLNNLLCRDLGFVIFVISLPYAKKIHANAGRNT
jgi:hypothetical protein